MLVFNEWVSVLVLVLELVNCYRGSDGSLLTGVGGGGGGGGWGGIEDVSVG